MKILFICENYFPHMGGAEVVFQNLAEIYVTLGHAVSVLTQRIRDTKKRETINGVKIYRVPSFNSRYFFTFSCIPQAIRLAKEYDVIQTTSFNGAPPAWLAARMTGKKVVITVHEVWIGKWQAVTGFPKWKSLLHDFLERLVYSLPYNRFICVSEATKKDLLKAKIPEKKALTIHNGFDYTHWRNFTISTEEEVQIRTQLGCEHKFMYFSWGRPGDSKGFEYAIQAAALIKDNIPDSVLVLMLNAQEKYRKKYHELLNLINNLGLSNYIKVIEPVSSDMLKKYIKAADCVVIPSIAEGFGYTTVEANNIGTPVVASDAGSIPEVISGKYLVFKNKDVRDLAEKVVMISQGKWDEAPLKAFPWDLTVEKYLEVYEGLLK